jgi:hypothetical protein
MLLLSAANHETLYYRADVGLTGHWIDDMAKMLDPTTGGVTVKITPIKRKWWRAILSRRHQYHCRGNAFDVRLCDKGDPFTC